MPFTLHVKRTVNGRERTLTWPGWLDSARPELERTIDDFRTGRTHMEGTLTLTSGSNPQTPDWARSWRWADIKNIWIEEEA